MAAICATAQQDEGSWLRNWCDICGHSAMQPHPDGTGAETLRDDAVTDVGDIEYGRAIVLYTGANAFWELNRFALRPATRTRFASQGWVERYPRNWGAHVESASPLRPEATSAPVRSVEFTNRSLTWSVVAHVQPVSSSATKVRRARRDAVLGAVRAHRIPEATFVVSETCAHSQPVTLSV